MLIYAVCSQIADHSKTWRDVLFAAPVYATLVVFLASCGEASPRQHTANGEVHSRSCASTPAPELARAFEQIDRLLDGTVREQAIPGVAAGVVCGRDLAWAQGYGVMALDDPRPVTPRTRFRIASLTKLFTATAVMLLKDRGILALSDRAARFVPWIETVARPGDSANTPITITHLLAHTSGLPRDSRLTDFRRLFQPAREEAIAALSSQQLQGPPGEANAYSNLGYAVLGEIIAEAAGTSYARFLEQELFAPLGMAETLVHPTPEDDAAWGHGPRRPDGSRAKAGFWQLRFATPAGGMASSVEGLSEFVRSGAFREDRYHCTLVGGGEYALRSDRFVPACTPVPLLRRPDRGPSGFSPVRVREGGVGGQ